MKKIIFLACFCTLFCVEGFSQSTSYAVSADKMNVLYVGVDNPITIGNSLESFDNTVVTATNATITGSGSQRIVRSNEVGEAKITVSPKGAKPSTFTFRVKSLPDPELRVGSGRKVRMPCSEFKSQDYIYADLENFSFDYKFEVLEATVYFSGENFPVPISAKILGNSLWFVKSLNQKCIPGSIITFDAVKVQAPEGPRMINGLTIALY
jgi:hypothetical protein